MDLKKEFIKSELTVGIGRYVNTFTQLFTAAILARFITPGEFGTIAAAIMVIEFIRTITQAGLIPAIIHFDFNDRDVSSLINIILSFNIILVILIFLSAPFTGHIFKNPQLAPIVRYLAIVIVLINVKIIPKGLLRKNLRFKISVVSETAASIISGICAVILVINHFGIISLVCQRIIREVLSLIFMWNALKLNYSFSFNTTPVQRLFKYCLFQNMTSTVDFFSNNMDKFLLASFLGPAQLGYYDRAVRLLSQPTRLLTQILSPAVQPVFGKMDFSRKGRAYTKLIINLMVVSLPAILFCVIASRELVVLIYGKQWIRTADLFSILSFAIPIQILFATFPGIYQSLGRTGSLFFIVLLKTIAITICIFLGLTLKGGTTGVAIGYVAGHVLSFFPLFIINLRNLKQDVVPVFTQLGKLLFAAVIVLIAAHWLEKAFPLSITPYSVGKLLINLSLKVILLFFILFPFYLLNGYIEEVKKIVLNRKKINT
jgi:O-antigen/teichoic acid export membrane protein